jgi:UDP-N-acetylmuramate dehydrogenase
MTAHVGDGQLLARVDDPLALHTAWRTGGRCDAFVVVPRVEALTQVIADCRAVDWKWTLLGAGTRMIVRDGGIPGVVVRLGREFGRMERVADERWQVGAGVPLPALVARMQQTGCAGMEPLACVPGSVGASIALDEGWESMVTAVTVLHRGRPVEVDWADARGGKRVVLGVALQMRPDSPDAVRRRVRKVLGAASGSRPAPVPSSWYEVPKKGTLRELFASVSLPMVRLRGVAIPDRAPELLVNLGGGTAADLALLHRSALERVRATRGVELSSRVLWAGQ